MRQQVKNLIPYLKIMFYCSTRQYFSLCSNYYFIEHINFSIQLKALATYKAFLENVDKYHIYEIIASEKICLLHNTHLKSFNNDYRYDFKTCDKLRYEVKTDELSLKTNNLFIEFESYKKPSGISITKANYYIFSDTWIII